MMTMEIHDACTKLPRMAAHEFAALVESIRQGWDRRYPILTHEGKILDGRHRYEACASLGIEPTFTEWDQSRCDGNPYRFVWQEHDARRNWQSAEQRQLCFNRSEGAAAEWEREHKRIHAEANAARSAKAKGNQNAAKSRPKNSGGTNSATTESKTSQHKSRAKKAAKAGTNRGAVQRAAKIEKLAAELGKTEVVDAVANGEVNAHAALKSLEEQKRKREWERPVEVDLAPGLHRIDFRDPHRGSSLIADGSVDLVFIDPPYDREAAALYEDAALMAARILKPGGSFIAYSGQRHLIEAMNGCAKHLRYWWTIAGVHRGGNQILNKLGIRCGWKPLLWFVKGTRADIQNVLLDVVDGSREKDAHHWQQAEAEAMYYIEHLTSPHGLVVDFFIGGGTTAVAAKKLGRSFIGFEGDASAIERASQRLQKVAA